MEKKALKTIFIIISSGIGGILLFIAAIIGYANYKFNNPETTFYKSTTSQNTVYTPPEVTEKDHFFGTTGRSSGSFPRVRKDVLAEGNGRIVGRVTVDNEPVKGLKLRLLLNGSVMSQWGVSNSDGKYTIKVPFGKYRIDGYELDHLSASSILAGKTDNPDNPYSGDTILVDEKKNGLGLNLDYIDPLIISGPKGGASLSAPIIITWEPYPNAKSYKIQLIEQKKPRDYMNQKYLFEWSNLPIVADTSFNVAEHGIKLKKDHYYEVEISALNEYKRKISDTGINRGNTNFLVTE